MGFGQSGATRLDLAGFPVGLNGLVFKTPNAEDTEKDARQAGIPASPANAFSRPVDMAGHKQDARFRTTHLPPETSGIGRVYFCEHLTPDLVWRPEWQKHPNGALQIVRVLVATEESPRQAALFAGLFGPDSITIHPRGATLTLSDGGSVVLAPVADVLGPLGDAAPDPAGRRNFMAALVIQIASVPSVAQLLREIPGLVVGPHRVTVPAKAAFNTTIVFEDEHAG